MSVSRVYRLLRLITMLQSGRSYTADELSLELEISRRTVFRDLNMLEMARVPYYFDDDHGGYKINQQFFLPPVNLTLPEALALLMLTRSLQGGKDLPLLSQGGRAAMKVESVLPAAVREHLGSVLDRLSFSLGPLSRHEGTDELFEQLASAVTKRQVCRIVYLDFASSKQVTMDVHPLRLVFRGRAWYMLAYSPAHKQVRTFKLIRIRKLTVTQKVFETAADLDVEKPFGQAWNMIPEGRMYDVHLRFDRTVAGNVAEVQWHASQQVQWNDDGSVDLRVRVDGLGEILWWIMGYGDRAEVISPAPLRKRVAKMADAMAARHADGEA